MALPTNYLQTWQNIKRRLISHIETVQARLNLQDLARVPYVPTLNGSLLLSSKRNLVM